MLRCLGGKWDVTQTHCQTSIKGIFVKEEVLVVLKYDFSAWENKQVHSSLYRQACSMIGGTFSSIYSSVVTYVAVYNLVGGPYTHTGFLQVSTIV